MWIVAFDTLVFRVVILDVLLRDGFFWSGLVEGVALAAELPGIRLEEFFQLGMVDMQVGSTMASFTGKIAVITFVLHGHNGIVATDTSLVSDKLNLMSSYLINRFPSVMTKLAKRDGCEQMF